MWPFMPEIPLNPFPRAHITHEEAAKALLDKGYSWPQVQEFMSRVMSSPKKP